MTPVINILILFFSWNAQATTKSIQSIGSPAVAYDKTEIVTCFLDTAASDLSQTVIPETLMKDLQRNPVQQLLQNFTDEKKQMIKESVTRTFSKKKTGINFVGFNNCSETLAPDLKLIFVNTEEETFEAAVLGSPLKYGRRYRNKPINSIIFHRGFFSADLEDIAYQKQMMVALQVPNLVSYVDESAKMRLSISVVHEFMHIAGLEHEFLRTDGFALLKKFDLSQNLTHSSSLILDARQHLESESTREISESRVFGGFDVFSIMNYQMNYFMRFSLEVEAVCATRLPVLTDTERAILCQSDKIDIFKMLKPVEDGFAADSDKAALASIYLHTEIKDAWSERNLSILKWLLPAKILTDKVLEQFH